MTVYTVAEKSGPIMARNQLSINPSYTISDCPPPQILVVPGGLGTRKEMNNTTLIDWIRSCSREADLLLLAKAGLLEGLAATTHHGAMELLGEVAPNTTIREDKRIVDNGKIVLSAGISAGIDMSLYVVSKLLGEEEALKTAHYMEYDWKPTS